jgi:choline-sulfatase
MYEESAAIPLILSGPDVPEGKVVSTPVSLADFYQTILEAVGVEPNEYDAGLPGESLYGFAQGPDEPDRTVFSEYHAAGADSASYMIRRGKFKYIHYVDYAPELFDLKADPEELNDLSASPLNQATLEKMESELRRILDPEEMDRRAKADQAALVELHGGREAVMSKPAGATPTPG